MSDIRLEELEKSAIEALRDPVIHEDAVSLLKRLSTEELMEIGRAASSAVSDESRLFPTLNQVKRFGRALPLGERIADVTTGYINDLKRKAADPEYQDESRKRRYAEREDSLRFEAKMIVNANQPINLSGRDEEEIQQLFSYIDELSMKNRVQQEAVAIVEENRPIKIAGRDKDELQQLQHEIGTLTAQNHRRSQRVNSNPVVQALDTIAQKTDSAVDTITNPITAATAFVKKNPGKAMLGGAGAMMLLSMLGSGSLKVSPGNLILVGIAALVGGMYLYSNKPEMFNQVAGSLGIDKYFNTAPAQPMLKSSDDKFGVSAASAGAIVVNEQSDLPTMDDVVSVADPINLRPKKSRIM